ncbi:hypothetical protein [Pedobacter sp. NJ-S-72]
MMRVEIPAPLKSGQQFVFNVTWKYKITDRISGGGRGGYEFFPKMVITFLQWHSGIPVYACTAIFRAGRITSLLAEENLH